MADEGFVYMKERRLPYPTFDADNHMYENQDALTKFIPKEYDGVIKYVEINGRTKIAIKDKLSDYIPNPTFNLVAVPGGYGRDVTKGGEGSTAAPRREAEDHAERRRLLRPRAAARAHEGHGHRPDAHVAHAGQRGRGAPGGRPRSGVRRRPRVERVDARALDVQLLGRDLRDAHHRLAGMDKAIEELQCVAERGAKDLPRPRRRRCPRTGPQVVRPARVRPVLGARHRARHRRRHALG